MSQPICFLDTETDGVHPDRKVWEVAMIRRDDTGQHETEFFVDIDLSTADPFGLKVGGFYKRHPLGQRLSAPLIDSGYARSIPPAGATGYYRTGFAAAVEVANWTHGATIVGAVPSFDADVLSRLLRSHGLTPAWHYHLIDVEPMAVGWLNGVAMQAVNDGVLDRADFGKTAPPYKSDELSLACGIDPPTDEERHTAMGDARWVMRWYDRLTGGTA